MPLWRLLTAVAGALQAIRGGQSGTTALAAVDAALRPGVQALLFQVLRNLGRAQALRQDFLDGRFDAVGGRGHCDMDRRCYRDCGDR